MPWPIDWQPQYMLSPRLRAQSVFQYCNGNGLSAAWNKTKTKGPRQVPFPITHIPNRISGQWSRQLWRWGRFERPGGCSVIHQEQQVLSLLLCWWPSTFRRSFSSPAKRSQCQNWRQHQCAVWDFFSPRKLFRTFDPVRGRIRVKVQNIYQQKQFLRWKWALKYPRPIQVCTNLL